MNPLFWTHLMLTDTICTKSWGLIVSCMGHLLLNELKVHLNVILYTLTHEKNKTCDSGPAMCDNVTVVTLIKTQNNLIEYRRSVSKWLKRGPLKKRKQHISEQSSTIAVRSVGEVGSLSFWEEAHFDALQLSVWGEGPKTPFAGWVGSSVMQDALLLHLLM